MVANFRPIKGQEFFVQAAAEVLRHREDVQFVVIGSTDSPYFLKVRDMIRELGIESKFLCVGDRADVQRLIPAFDIFVLSSLQEGFSNALVEAMSVGVVPVAAAWAAIRKRWEQGRNGFLFPAKDYRALARHLLTLLGDDELRERLGAAAAAAARANFSFEGMIDKVHDVLLESLGERFRARRP